MKNGLVKRVTIWVNNMKEFTIKTIDQMSGRDLFCVSRLRINSFVSEQLITEPELDDTDLIASHVYLLNDQETCALATCRVFQEDSRWLVGRVAVSKAARGQNLGRKVMETAHQFLRQKDAKSVYCHAQLQAKGFYEKLGYEPIGEIFEEAGIKHILMKKKLG